MNFKKLTITLISIIGVVIVSALVFAGILILQKSLIPSIAQANPACTVNDDLTVTGTFYIGYEIVSDLLVIPPGAQNSITVNCPAVKKVIGGGCRIGIGSIAPSLDYPPTESSWKCAAYNPSAVTNMNLWVYAICARVDN